MNTFRHNAGFGKRIEYWVIGRMLKEGMDVYIPLVDDHAVDAIIKRCGWLNCAGPNQGSVPNVRRRRRGLVFGDSAPRRAARLLVRLLFRTHGQDVDSTSGEFIAESVQNKTGKNIGLRSIWFNGRRKNKTRGVPEPYCKERYEKYLATYFSRIAKPLPDESFDASGGSHVS